MKNWTGIILFLISLLLIACEANEIGTEIQPTEDKMAVKTDSFTVSATSALVTNRYSESDKLLLGNYEDPIYGSAKFDFLAEFRYLNADFPATAKATSVQVVMYYKTFFGDSTAVQEATVYQLNNPLKFEENYTTDINLSEFCDKSKILGKKVYVAYDPTVPDSVKESEEYEYCNTVKIDLPLSIGEKLIADRSITTSQTNFLNLIKGVYITNEFVGQVVLNVDSVNLEVAYDYVPKASKPDSIVNDVRIYPVNKEATGVIRISDVKAPDLESIPDSLLYLSSYVGVAPKVEIPIDRIREKLGYNEGDIISINNMSIILEEALCADSSLTELTMPPYVILVREADIDKFFTQSLYPAAGINTVLGVYEKEIRAYRFNNVADYLHNLLYTKAEADKINPFYVLPVTGATDIQGTDAVIRHQFRPSGIRLRSPQNENSNMRLSITYTKL
jgi:hypothetical protein